MGGLAKFLWLALACLWTAFCAVFTITAFLLNENLGHRMHHFWAYGLCVLYRVEVDILFQHHLPKNRGTILAPNHQSMFDMPILGMLPSDFKYVSKREIRSIPFLGWALRAMGTYFISRNDSSADLNVMKEVEEGLLRGNSVLLFPEGTRTRDGLLQPLKKGAFRVCMNTGAPLCPIAIEGSYPIAPPGSLPKLGPHKVTLRIGAPLYPLPGEDVAALMIRYQKELVRLLEEGSAA